LSRPGSGKRAVDATLTESAPIQRGLKHCARRPRYRVESRSARPACGRRGAEVDGFDAGDGEVCALGCEQSPESIEIIMIFGDDLAEATIGDAVGRLQTFNTAQGFAGG